MAAKRQSVRRTTQQQRQYRTNGSAAYQPGYEGNTVRAPRKAQPAPQQPRPQVRPRRRIVQRPQVQVRQANAVSPSAVAGLALVVLFTVLLLIANVRLMVISDQTVALRNQLKELQSEQVTLLAKRELSYDLDAIKAQLTADGTMVKPQPSQITYLDNTAPDSVVIFRTPQRQGLGNLVESILDFFSDLVS